MKHENGYWIDLCEPIKSNGRVQPYPLGFAKFL